MKNTRTVVKHFGPDIAQTSTQNNIYLKTLGESWVEIHTPTSLSDIISLPISLRMGRLEAVKNSFCDGSNLSQLCIGIGNSLWIGRAQQQIAQTVGDYITFNKSHEISKVAYINQSLYCNMGQNQNNSMINFIKRENRELQLQKDEIQISVSEVLMERPIWKNDRLLFIGGKQDKNLLSFDPNSQNVQFEAFMPDVGQDDKFKCFSFNEQRIKNLIGVYSKDFIGIADLRTKRFVNIIEMHRCQTVFTSNRSSTQKIYCSQGNEIKQYDIRKGRCRREAVVEHSSEIQSCDMQSSDAGESMCLTDTMSPNLYFYESENARN